MSTRALALVVAVLAGPAFAEGKKDKDVDPSHSVFVKHFNMAGGDITRCAGCHNGEKADTPPVLKGRYANIGGPNHGCYDCHHGDKAPLLPLPRGATS